MYDVLSLTVDFPHKFLYFPTMCFATMGHDQESGASRQGENEYNFNWHLCLPKSQSFTFQNQILLLSVITLTFNPPFIPLNILLGSLQKCNF